MKSVKSKFSPRKKKTANSPLTPELNSFNIATEISEHQQQQQQPPPPQRRSIFNNIRPTSRPSQQSLATHPSFVTAPDTPNSTTLVTPAAASYFVDSSDDEDTQHTEESQLKFGNDPLAVLSKQTTPTEITITNDPELTMPSKRTVAKKAAAPAPVIATKVDEPAKKFDVAQHVYGFTKDAWGWGKTVPVVSALLGAAEAVVSELVKKVLNKDLPAIDSEAVAPNLKKLDDDIVTPTILKCWEIIGPAVCKVDDVAVKPVVTEVLPKVLGIVGMGGKSESEKKAEEKKMMVDHSPTPEVTAFN